MPSVRRARWQLAARWAVAVFVLGLVFRNLDKASLTSALLSIPAAMIGLALAVSVLQVLVSAWRWQYTARRLSVPLALQTAVREYYLATFLNQVLPGGVLGDVSRAWRHGQRSSARLSAFHGVVIERVSGQLALLAIVLISVSGLMVSGVLPIRPGGQSGAFFLLALAVLSAGIWLLRQRWQAYGYRLWRDVKAGLLEWPALGVQLASSLLVQGLYLTVFVILALAMGSIGSMADLWLHLALASLLLLSMAIPLTVAGWGVREAAATGLWPLAGLPAEQGVALSVAYGAVFFLSSLPGLWFLIPGRVRIGQGV